VSQATAIARTAEELTVGKGGSRTEGPEEIGDEIGDEIGVWIG
jgi:hypothetical protein